MKIIAEIISLILSPVLIPLYAFLTLVYSTFLATLPPEFISILIGVIALFTAGIPGTAMLWLHYTGRMSDMDNPRSDERTIPYIISVIGYAACIYILHRMAFPLWMTSLLIGGAIMIICMTIINRWWRISAHMAGIGAYIGLIFMLGRLGFVIRIEWLVAIIISAGLLGSCRIYLKRHTLGQVLAGAVFGFIWTCLTLYIGVILI